MSRGTVTRRNQRGSAVVDFVLVSALVVPLFLGVMQLGLFLYVRNTVAAAASDGARYAAVSGRTPAEGVERTRSALDGAVARRLVDDVRTDISEVEGQRVVAITVDAHLPALGLWGPRLSFTQTGHGIVEPPRRGAPG